MGKRNSDPDSLTVIGHLDELRAGILRGMLFLLSGALVGLYFARDIVLFLQVPAGGMIERFLLLRPTEIVAVYVKVALYAGAVLSFPFILHQAWIFVKPALPAGARPSFVPWVVPAALLFLLGNAFAYQVLVPAALRFLLALSRDMALTTFTLGGYVSFVLALMAVSGIVFEMPLAAALLTRLRVLSPELMREKRKEALFACFVAAALLTPTTDVFNLLLFALPMAALYEASILVSGFVRRAMNRDPSEELYAR